MGVRAWGLEGLGFSPLSGEALHDNYLVNRNAFLIVWSRLLWKRNAMSRQTYRYEGHSHGGPDAGLDR